MNWKTIQLSLNKNKLFLTIWLIHLFVYYTSYGIIIRLILNDFEAFIAVFAGFLAGLMGLIEFFPLFFLIPLFFMLLLIKTIFKNKWLLAFIFSSSLCYILNYIRLLSQRRHLIEALMPDEKNSNLYLIIPSLIISILCNWLIFRKTYKRLGV